MITPSRLKRIAREARHHKGPPSDEDILGFVMRNAGYFLEVEARRGKKESKIFMMTDKVGTNLPYEGVFQELARWFTSLGYTAEIQQTIDYPAIYRTLVVSW